MLTCLVYFFHFFNKHTNYCYSPYSYYFYGYYSAIQNRQIMFFVYDFDYFIEHYLRPPVYNPEISKLLILITKKLNL